MTSSYLCYRWIVILKNVFFAWWGCGEIGALIHCWECKVVQPLWKTVGWFFKKLKLELPYDPTISYPKELTAGFWSDACTPMFIAALFTTAKRWKQLTRAWMAEWVNKMWSVHSGMFFSLKREEIFVHATTWVNPEHTVLLEIGQSQKNKCYMIPLVWGT